MANIEPYINEIQTARYGEEVRGSIVNALLKVNDDNESYIGMKEEIEDIRDAMTFYRLITLNAAGWDENFEQIKVIDGILADESKQVIEIVPSKTHLDVYLDCKVTCINQGENSLTFKAVDKIPSVDLNVFIFIKYVAGSQVDDELDSDSINPVQNKVIAGSLLDLTENAILKTGGTMSGNLSWSEGSLPSTTTGNILVEDGGVTKKISSASITVGNATHATNADNATNATNAVNASKASLATRATNADSATNATTATTATTARKVRSSDGGLRIEGNKDAVMIDYWKAGASSATSDIYMYPIGITFLNERIAMYNYRSMFGSDAMYLDGNINVDGDVKALNNVKAQALELSFSTPFIDFHKGDSSADYTTRLIQREDDMVDLMSDGTYWGALRCRAIHSYGGGGHSCSISFHYNQSDSITSEVTARGSNRVDIVGPNGGNSCKLYAGSFTQYSSKYLKKNIKTMTKKEAEKLLELRPVSFDYKNGDKNQRGLVAEEVQEIYPEMVIAPDGFTEFKEDEPWNALSIDYARFVPALIKMIQIQDERITALEKALKEVTK